MTFTGDYNPGKHTIAYFFNHASKNLDKGMENYDNFLLVGDFNSTMTEKQMSDFCMLYDLSNLITELTCYKKIQKSDIYRRYSYQ